MIINLLIRTYVVNNLYISLFDIPNKINSDNVEIYIHNDNPNNISLFNTIIKDFQLKYPDYKLNVIQESENQDMFMSYLNSMNYLNSNNLWSMLLDDDDTLCDFNKIGIFDFLENIDNVCVKYKIYTIKDSIVDSNYFSWHRLYPTKILKKIYKHKQLIVKALLIHNKSIKFNKLEDELMYRIIQLINPIKTITFKKELVNYSLYYHNVNGYESGNKNLMLTLKNKNIIRKVLYEIKCNINNYDSSAIHK